MRVLSLLPALGEGKERESWDYGGHIVGIYFFDFTSKHSRWIIGIIEWLQPAFRPKQVHGGEFGILSGCCLDEACGEEAHALSEAVNLKPEVLTIQNHAIVGHDVVVVAKAGTDFNIRPWLLDTRETVESFKYLISSRSSTSHQDAPTVLH